MTVRHFGWILVAVALVLGFSTSAALAETPKSPESANFCPISPPPPEGGDADDPIPDEEDEESAAAEDGAPALEEAAVPTGGRDLPFADLTDAEIKRRLQDNPTSLGSISVGYTNRGALVNGVQMPPSDHWVINNPRETWGTQETIDDIITALEVVNAIYPNSPPLSVGDISDRNGGRLNRHKSHQAGRDVDLGFYYSGGGCRWFTPGNGGNMDLARNWALVRALVVYTDVEMILLDSRIQRALYDYAASIGEDRAWLSEVFQFPNGSKRSVVRHARRHHTHYHVRFYNARAQEMGRRAFSSLLAMKLVQPPAAGGSYRVRKGDTLASVARKTGVSTASLRKMTGGKLRPGQTIRTAGRRTNVSRVPGPLTLPARRLPPNTPAALAKVAWTTTGGGAGPLITRPLAYGQDALGHRIAFLADATTLASLTPRQTAPAAPAAASTVVASAAPVAATPESVDDGDDAREPVVKPAGVKAKGAKQSVRYRVRSGDNLWTIARKYGVSVKDIRAWNSLRSEKLSQGQTLLLYVKK